MNVPSSLVMIVLQVAAQARLQASPSSSTAIRDEREAFLSKGRIVTDAPPDGRRSWRVSLDDGIRRHDASVETADGSDHTRRDYRFNVAAYDLDKLLDLDLVPPSIERAVGGRPASLTWWVDDVAMNELDRRRRTIDPPDPESWSRQVAAVRVFDELISNTYRDTSPGLYLNTVWDNLLITKDWTIWIIDHTAAFRARQGSGRFREPKPVPTHPAGHFAGAESRPVSASAGQASLPATAGCAGDATGATRETLQQASRE